MFDRDPGWLLLALDNRSTHDQAQLQILSFPRSWTIYTTFLNRARPGKHWVVIGANQQLWSSRECSRDKLPFTNEVEIATLPRKRAALHRHELQNGDRMTQAEFHRAYEQMPQGYRAELIGGIVHEPSPPGWPHAENDAQLGHLLTHYAVLTEGLSAAHSPSVILSDNDEVQPDVVLRIKPELGRSKNAKGEFPYVLGAPELVAEVAHSSRAIDLHLKKDRYSLGQVPEYIILCLKPPHFYWFDLSMQDELKPCDDGIWCSRIFPGL